MDEDFLQTFMLAIVSGCFDNVDNFDDELEEILTALLSAGNAGERSDFFEEWSLIWTTTGSCVISVLTGKRLVCFWKT